MESKFGQFSDADSVDDALNESSISENEDEWVPSSWDSLAKPSRSALKSPDKSSSVSIDMIVIQTK